VTVLLLAAGFVAAGVVAQREAAPRQTTPSQTESPKENGKKSGLASLVAEKQVRTDRYGDPLPPKAEARLGTTRFRHSWRVMQAMFSPDGKMLITNDTGSICFWEPITGKELRRWPFLNFSAAVQAISPDNSLLAVRDCSIPQNAKIRLLDAATGTQTHLLEGHPGGVRAAVFSPDGKLLASGGGDKTVRLWNPTTGQEVRRLEGHQSAVCALAFSPDGKTLVTATERDGIIRLWDVATGIEQGRLSRHQGEIRSVAFAVGGAMLASGGDDKTIRLWDLPTRKEICVLGQHPTEVGIVAFSPDGKLLASSGVFDTIALWDVQAGKELRRWQAPGYYMHLGGFSSDGKTLASVSSLECAPRLWDVATGREVGPPGGHRSPIDWLTFAPDGQTLISSEKERVSLLRWQLATGEEKQTFTLPLEKLIRSGLSPDGKTLATWERLDRAGGIVRLWDAATHQELHQLGQHTWTSDRAEMPRHPLAFSSDGKQLASVDRESIVLWDVATGRKVRDFLAPQGEVHCVAFAPDGRTVGAGIREGGTARIFLWDVATGKELHAFGHDAVETLVFSPDGKLLATGCWDLPVRLWDVATGKERLALTGLDKGVCNLAFSPDGKHLASAVSGQNTTVCVCEVLTGQVACRFGDDKLGAYSLAFAPDGRTVASGNGDSTILLWDLTGNKTAGGLQPSRFGATMLENLWDDLGGNAAKAHEAVWQLVAVPGQAVPLLHERLHPAVPVDNQRIQALIAKLDSDSFAVRQQSTAELEKLGELIEPELRKALEAKPALEVRRRLGQLLEKLEGPVTSPNALRGFRAIEVLENIADRDARQVLQRLARGTPEARLTQEARASLQRLANW
jgi:WD40 repeat protein